MSVVRNKSGLEKNEVFNEEIFEVRTRCAHGNRPGGFGGLYSGLF